MRKLCNARQVSRGKDFLCIYLEKHSFQGESGFVLKKKDEGLLLEIVEKAINCDKEKMANAAREQIIKNYTILKAVRREGIGRLIT